MVESQESPAAGWTAVLVRMSGWLMLAVLAAFLINNVLLIGFGLPGPAGVLESDNRAWVSVSIYAVLALASLWFVIRTPDATLRGEARRISDFNAYLIRGCFFTVLFTGIIDAAIAVIRVEGLLPVFFPEGVAQDLIRSHFIGPYIHFPLAILGFAVASVSRSLGFVWLALLIVLAELLIVVSRFVFSYEQALMGDLVRYWYAALFLFSSAYTLLHEGHVRVDVLYSGFDLRKKGRTNAVGAILLGMTTSWAIILVGMGNKQSILNSPVANFEVSQTGTAGMFIKYQMAVFLSVFAVTMLIQFISYLFDAVADARMEPGHVDHELPIG